MKDIFSCLLFFAAVASRVCHASTCVNDTTTDNDDKYDVAAAKIKEIMKETCSCPMFLRPVDCEEVLKNGNTKSGVYTIWPKKPVPGCESLKVYCDMDTDGGGWTVIQRRGVIMIPDDFFNQNWKTYKTGFGDLTKEFWLGNDNIFSITHQGSYVARFEMRNSKGQDRYAVYQTFFIDGEDKNYRLNIGGYDGTAGDALTAHNQGEFYTKDKPNIPKNVTKKTRKVPNGGWWFNVFPSTSLNGLKKTKDKDGIVWQPFGDYYPPLVSSEIKLRAKRI